MRTIQSRALGVLAEAVLREVTPEAVASRVWSENIRPVVPA